MVPVLLAPAQVAVVDLHAQWFIGIAGIRQLALQRVAGAEHRRALFGVLVDRQDHDLLRRKPRRQHHAVVVAVGHDQAADQPRGHPPRGGPGVHERAVAVAEADVARLGEVLPQEVRGAGLQRPAVLHHRLDGVGVDRPGEALARGLLAAQHRHRHVLLGEVRVHAQHAQGLLDRLLGGGVDGVAFLPQELGGAQEQARAQLPAHDVRPLVDQDRQVPVGLHPLGVHLADDRLAGGPHHVRLVQLSRRHQPALRSRLQPVVGHHRALLGEALDVLGLPLQVAQRDEQREVGVGVAGVLEHAVEDALHVLPQRVAPRLDHHAAAHRRQLRQVGGAHHLLIPLGVVLVASRRDRRAS